MNINCLCSLIVLWMLCALALLVGFLFYTDYLFTLEHLWIMMLGVTIVVVPAIYVLWSFRDKW
jgi:hypothetical protein